MEKEKARALFEERKELFDKAIHMEHTYRVPTAANGGNWFLMNTDDNYSLDEVLLDYDIREKVQRETQERYCFDATGNGNTYNLYFTRAMKNAGYIIENDAVNYVDRDMIADDDLVEASKDPMMYAWTHVGPKFFGMLTYADAREALRAMMNHAAIGAQWTAKLLEEYGVLFHINTTASNMHPIEEYYFTRGLKNFGLDMRRRPQQLMEAVENMTPAFLARVEGFLSKEKDEHQVFDSLTSMLIHSIMNHKQFEKFYFPLAKKTMDMHVEAGKTTLLYWEADAIRLADFYADFPKGTISIFPEMEDARDIRKAFPNMAVFGGFPMNLLKNGTKEECVDFAKRLIDDMGDGFVFSTDKMLTYRYDANRENLMAVQEFVLNYKV